jgi:Na+-translocating ferredoxin:NAD+ oxidoreductase RnfG subunit
MSAFPDIARHSRLVCLTLPALVGSTSGYAVTYLTTEQAMASLLPGGSLSEQSVQLTRDQCQAIGKAAGVRVRVPAFKAWRTAEGTWFLVDQVIGKHEFITYAVTINAQGRLQGLEILDYRESYGGEVRHEKWRGQFVGQTAAAPLKLDADIKNITGATLSCRNVTDGVKRLLVTHELVLRHRP